MPNSHKKKGMSGGIPGRPNAGEPFGQFLGLLVSFGGFFPRNFPNWTHKEFSTFGETVGFPAGHPQTVLSLCVFVWFLQRGRVGWGAPAATPLPPAETDSSGELRGELPADGHQGGRRGLTVRGRRFGRFGWKGWAYALVSF